MRRPFCWDRLLLEHQLLDFEYTQYILEQKMGLTLSVQTLTIAVDGKECSCSNNFIVADLAVLWRTVLVPSLHLQHHKTSNYVPAIHQLQYRSQRVGGSKSSTWILTIKKKKKKSKVSHLRDVDSETQRQTTCKMLSYIFPSVTGALYSCSRNTGLNSLTSSTWT